MIRGCNILIVFQPASTLELALLAACNVPGLPTDEKGRQAELELVTFKTKELLKTDLAVLISVYTLLDRVQHFHWGEDCVLDWYMKVDKKIGGKFSIAAF